MTKVGVGCRHSLRKRFFTARDNDVVGNWRQGAELEVVWPSSHGDKTACGRSAYCSAARHRSADDARRSRDTKQHAERADISRRHSSNSRATPCSPRARRWMPGRMRKPKAHRSRVQRILTKAEPGLVSAPGGSPETWAARSATTPGRSRVRGLVAQRRGLRPHAGGLGAAGRLSRTCGAAPRIDRGGKMTTSGQCCAIALMAARSWVSPPGLPSRTPFPLRRAVPPPPPGRKASRFRQ